MSRNYLLLLLLASLLLLSACEGGIVRGPGKDVAYEGVLLNTSEALNTSNGVMIAGSYYPNPSSEKGLILLHMLARNRHTFDGVAEELMQHYKVLSIDLRGHGESEGDYLDLAEEDFNLMVEDVATAEAFLRQEGATSISIAGASIGANIALIYASEHKVDKLVLISPGDRLRGIDISRLSYNKPLLVQVAHYDAYSSISVDSLEMNWERGRVMKYDSSAHGTDLLAYDLSAKEDFLFYLT